MVEENNSEKLKIQLLNISIIVLLTALILSTNKIQDVGVLWIYISTWMLILHIWLGTYYIIKYLEQKRSIVNNTLNLVSLICMVIGVLFFHKLEIWAASFAILFMSAITIYKIIGSSTKNKLIKEYTNKKIRNEIVSVPLLIFLAVSAYMFKEDITVIRFLQIMTLFFQFFFLIWLIHIKKVYFIFKKVKPSN